MTNEEILYIDLLLDSLRPKRCLEWGSGNSTIYFPIQHPSIERWESVEHTLRWYRYVRVRMNENVTLHLRNIDNYLEVDGTFDFILIDGILRSECLEVAKGILNPKGIIILHDAEREEYKKGIDLYGDKKELIIKGKGEGEECQQGIMKLWV